MTSRHSAFSAAAWISEKLGNGWMVSRSTASGTRARTASVACWSHSPASGPSAYAPVSTSPSLRSVRNPSRSEEHTSVLQSHVNLVCRLLLEKKKELYGKDMPAL